MFLQSHFFTICQPNRWKRNGKLYVKLLIMPTQSSNNQWIHITSLGWNWHQHDFHGLNSDSTCRIISSLRPNLSWVSRVLVNTLRPKQNGRHFADDTFKCIFLNANVRISIEISLKFVFKGAINNIPALVQIMAWRRPGDEPLSETMLVSLLTHKCITQPQYVNGLMLNRPQPITWSNDD